MGEDKNFVGFCYGLFDVAEFFKSLGASVLFYSLFNWKLLCFDMVFLVRFEI